MAVYSKERPELELESFFRSLYASTRRGIRENWLRLREDPEISQWEIGEVDRIWIRLYRELVEQRPDLEPLFNEPRDLSRFPQKGWMRPCSVLIDGMFRAVGPETLLREEEQEEDSKDMDKWDAMYPEEAKERSARHWREMGLKE